LLIGIVLDGKYGERAYENIGKAHLTRIQNNTAETHSFPPHIFQKEVINIDLANIEEKIKQIKLLMRELENAEPDIYKIQKLKTILNEIGIQKELYTKFKNLFDAAAEVLISASIEANARKCDPTQKRPPDEYK